MKIFASTAVLLFNANRDSILLAKRLRAPNKGYYAVAGGKIDSGEHPAEAAAREVFEETGIRLDPKQLIPFPEITSYVFPELQTQFFCFWFSCMIDEEKVDYIEKDHEGNPKSEAWDWHKIDNLPEPLFAATARIARLAAGHLWQPLAISHIVH